MGRRAGTNRISNPSFETNTTGWGPSAGVTIVRSTTQAWTGAASGLISMPTADFSSVSYLLDLTGLTLTGVPHLLTTKVRLRATLGVAAGFFYVNVFYSGQPLQRSTLVPIIGTGDWQTVALAPMTTNPAFTITNIQVAIDSWAPSVPAFSAYLDGVDLRIDEPDTDDYIDGSLGAGYAWTGTAHGSTSTRTAIPDFVLGPNDDAPWRDGPASYELLITKPGDQP